MIKPPLIWYYGYKGVRDLGVSDEVLKKCVLLTAGLWVILLLQQWQSWLTFIELLVCATHQLYEVCIIFFHFADEDIEAQRVEVTYS